MLICGVYQGMDCKVPDNVVGRVLVKVFNSGGWTKGEAIVVGIPVDKHYVADCDYEKICLC